MLLKNAAPSRSRRSLGRAARRAPATEGGIVARAVRPVLEALEGRQLFAATLTLINPFALPASNRLMFNVIGNPNSQTPANVTHSEQAFTLKNTGTSTLTISSMTISGPFVFLSGTTTSTTMSNLSLAAGQSTTVTIEFVQASVPAHTVNETNYIDHVNGGAYIGGSLTIVSNDSTTPTQVVGLEGYYQQISNNNEEPSLQTLVNRMAGYQVNLGVNDNGSTTSLSSPKQTDVDLVEPTGSALLEPGEVDPASWEQANAALPVSIQEFATFRTQGNLSTTYWYSASDESSHFLFRTTTAEGQTVLPTVSNNEITPLTATFNPGGVAFGLRVDNEYSDDAINVGMENATSGGHHFRFFPLVDQNGNAVANTYLVVMDYSVTQAENYDFQDNAFIVSNIRPSTAPDAPTGLTVTNGAAPTLSWTASVYTPVGYDVYRSSTATGTYALLNSTPLTTTTYTDSTLGSTATAYYEVKAVDSTQSPAQYSAAVSAVANAGPIVASPTYGVTAGAAFTFNALAGATDSTGTIVPSSLAISTGPNEGGTATTDGAGNITYTAKSTYTGVETLSYTVADNGGLRSTPGTVTFNVAAVGSVTTPTPTPTGTPSPTPTPTTTSPGTLVTNTFVGLTLQNTAITLAVLGADQAATSFAANNPVAIVGAASDGTAVANADGTITYTPSKGFVGSDAFTYKATDANGTVSGATTVDVNVGVAIGTGTAYTKLAFTDEDHTAVTVSLNRGTADVYFDSSSSAATTTAGKTITVTGSGLHIRTILLSGTTAASTLSILGKGNGQVTLGGVDDAAPLGTLAAKTSNLVTNGGSSVVAPGNPYPAGSINLAGVHTMQLDTAVNATIILGPSSGTTAVSFASTVSGTSLTSTAPITSFKAATWTGAAYTAPDPITAPSIATLTIPGEFDADLTLTAAPARASDLGSAKVGSIANGSWVVAGNVGNVTIGTAAAAFGGANVTGSVNTFTVSKGNLSADLTAATVNAFRVGGTFGADLITTGSVNTVTVGGLVDADVLVGNTTSLGEATTADIGTSTLKTLTVTGRGAAAFNDSVVIAHSITGISTGQVNASTTAPEGIAAVSIRSAAIGVDGGTVRFNAKQLVSDATVKTALGTKTLGSFDLDIVS